MVFSEREVAQGSFLVWLGVPRDRNILCLQHANFGTVPVTSLLRYGSLLNSRKMAKRKTTDNDNGSLNDPPRRSTRQKIAQNGDINSKPTSPPEQQRQSSKRTSIKKQKMTEPKQEANTRNDELDACQVPGMDDLRLTILGCQAALDKDRRID